MSDGRSARFLRLEEAPGPVRHYTAIHFAGSEAVSDLFQFRIDVETLEKIPPPESFIGQPASFYVGAGGGDHRYFSAQIIQCEVLTRQTDFIRFRLHVSAALWSTTIRENCCVFQNKTVKEVVADVLRKYPDVLFDDSGVTGAMARLPLITQFYETDFNFISRLMEREGIYYYFRHDKALGGRFRHKMFLHDSSAGYFTADLAKVDYQPNDNVFRAVRDYQSSNINHASRFAMHDYEYRAPATKLDVNRPSRHSWADPNGEIYLYPGGYRDRTNGARIVQIAAEREEAKAETTSGISDVNLLQPGMKVEIAHPLMESDHRKVVVLSVEHKATDPSLTNVKDPSHYSNSFTALPASKTYRPPQNADRTRMHGLQTGFVVGPKNEEIHTDDMGRIRVHYQWDRDHDLKSTEGSFWCRVAQPWAGNGFGSQFLPRVGMEVVIDFIGGDPDRPIVVGCVYNGANRQPYKLPASKTLTALRTRSSPGGKTRNELVFEDKAGQEKVYVFAGRDSERIVEHDEHIEVRNDRKVEIKHDEDYAVGRNESVKIGGRLTVDVKETVDITAGQRITLRVGKSSISIDHSGVRIDGPRIDYLATGPLSIRSNVHAEVLAPVTEVKGNALANVQAPLVKIN